MNRTWRDAAAEVAWNKSQKRKFYMNTVNFNPALFLANQNPFREAFDSVKTGICFINTNFFDFRAAFMKWLDENEVKK